MPFRHLDKLEITRHSVERYRNRYRVLHQKDIPYSDAEILIQEHLYRSEVEKIRPKSKLAKRFKKNRNSVYYIDQGWRFIVSQKAGGFVLMTCERTKPSQNHVHTTLLDHIPYFRKKRELNERHDNSAQGLYLLMG